MEQQNITPDTLKTSYVSPETCVFSCSDNGFLEAEIDGLRYRRVILTRALPLTTPDRYVCISDVEKKELGIIEDIAAFSADQQKLIRDELDKRYFCPAISTIDGIREKMGQFYFDVHIGTKKKSFTVKDISKNIRMNGKEIDIIDVDANRYRILDFAAIPAKSRRKLEPYVY